MKINKSSWHYKIVSVFGIIDISDYSIVAYWITFSIFPILYAYLLLCAVVCLIIAPFVFGYTYLEEKIFPKHIIPTAISSKFRKLFKTPIEIDNE